MTMSRDPAPPTGPEPPAAGAAPLPVSDPADVLARLGRSWTWILCSAVATLVPGILVLVWPEETLHVLAVLIGLYLLVTGAFRFVAVFGREEHGERLPGLLLAVLYVLAGVLSLRNPLQSASSGSSPASSPSTRRSPPRTCRTAESSWAPRCSPSSRESWCSPCRRSRPAP